MPVTGEMLPHCNKAMRVDRNANPIPSPGYPAKGGGALTQLFNLLSTLHGFVITLRIKNLS
jgi:hypothetical protein